MINYPPNPSAYPKLISELSNVPVIVVLDHARAGNSFFVRLFDQHPNILTIPIVGYLPYVLENLFDSHGTITGKIAYNYLLESTDVRKVFSELTDEIKTEIIRLGDDPLFPIDRKLGRETLLGLLNSQKSLSRKTIITCIHLAYAIATGRSLSDIRYILLSDAPLLYQTHFNTTAESIYARNSADLDNCQFIHLVRDPRANFASLRHQYIRQWNGYYRFGRNRFGDSLLSLFIKRVDWSLLHYILDYTSSGSKELNEWKNRAEDKFIRVRNEDLNRNFLPTMMRLVNKLGIEFYSTWNEPNYVPSSCGATWLGVGAYNKKYQNLTEIQFRSRGNSAQRRPQVTPYRFKTTSHLQNESSSISHSHVGPNRHVTERWKTRLSKREILLLEYVYQKELVDLNYQFMLLGQDDDPKKLGFIFNCFFPLTGEGLSMTWLKYSLTNTPFKQKIFSLLEIPMFGWFYVISRISLVVYVFGNKFSQR